MPDSPISTAWNRWQRSAAHNARRFEAALRDPAAAQTDYLRRTLKGAEGTHWAKTYGIDTRCSLADFRARAPVMDGANLPEWTDRIVRGEARVLTREPVERLVPTSGTTGANKLVPMSESSRREYADAVDLWMYECLRTHPSIASGRAYIATSPALDYAAHHDSAVPVGFAKDTDYLGPVPRTVLSDILAVPPDVAALRDRAWREATREHLLSADDLSFLSLWHPGYLDALFDDDELRNLNQRWPQLALISCWADGATSESARRLAKRFPDVPIEPKGLWLTEGVVSLPWRGRHPLALLSGFFEFESENGDLRLAHELEHDMLYRPILTNRSGLYRYRLGDEVRVDGFIGATPSIRWVGRVDHVEDLCGEKLSDAQVAEALQRTGWDRFFLLLPDVAADPARYICLIDEADRTGFPLESFIEALRRNPHFDWSLKVGQLAPLTVRGLNEHQKRKMEKMQRDDQSFHLKADYLIKAPTTPATALVETLR